MSERCPFAIWTPGSATKTGYLAYGRMANQDWQGIWGYRGVGRLCEFGYGLTEREVQQNMLDDAAFYAKLATQRAMYDEGFWRGGRA